MNYDIYTAVMIANDMIKDRRREAAKERQWAQAKRYKRNQAKLKS